MALGLSLFCSFQQQPISHFGGAQSASPLWKPLCLSERTEFYREDTSQYSRILFMPVRSDNLSPLAVINIVHQLLSDCATKTHSFPVDVIAHACVSPRMYERKF